MGNSIRILAGAMLVFGVLAARANGKSPSFDCAKATLATERAICGSQTLSTADVRLAHAYKTALQMVRQHWQIKFTSLAAGEKAVRQGQKSWLKERNRCRDVADCIRVEIGSRTRELNALAIQLFDGANPKAFLKPIKLDENHPQKVDFHGDETGQVIRRSYIKAKEEGDYGAYVLKLSNPAGGYTEIDVPILSYSIPKSTDPSITYPDVYIWAHGGSQSGSDSNSVLEQDATISEGLGAILGRPGILLGIDIYEDTGCPRSCSTDNLYLLFVDHNLHVTPLLKTPWGFYDGSSAWGNSTVESNDLALFAGNDDINAMYLRFVTKDSEFQIDQNDPCNPNNSSSKTIVYYYRMSKGNGAFEVQQGDPKVLSGEGDLDELSALKVKYIPAETSK